MKMYKLYTVLFALLLSCTAIAQVKAPTTATKQTANSSDSLKQAMTNLKSSFNTLFGASKKDTISITISNIDYDDSALVTLKDNLKTLKGAKPLSMQYKAGNAIIEVCYKSTATNLWDELPPPAKKPFRLLEASDKAISLQFKNAKPSP